jgi:hypothetical protein
MRFELKVCQGTFAVHAAMSVFAAGATTSSFYKTSDGIRIHYLTLKEFIVPIHDALEKSSDVRQVKQRRTEVAAELENVRNRWQD